jgi:putative ABC transport system permease protein
MRVLDIIKMRLRSLLDSKRVDRELDDELRFHLERQIEESLAAGMSRDAADHAARRTIGGIAIEEQCRDARGLNFVESIFKDAQLAFRTLRRDSTFTIVSVLTLALGIGITTAIFTVVDRVILRPLPFSDPGRLVTLWETNPQYPGDIRFSPGNYLDLRAQHRAFEQVGGLALDNYNLTGAGDADRVTGGLVSGNLLSMLGARAELGRVFAPSDDSYTAERTVILSHKSWVDRFGGDPQVIGKALHLDDRSHTIVGVMPAGFQILNYDVDLWLPIERKIDPDQMHWRQSYYVAVIARMKPGVTLEQARQDTDRVVQNIRRDHPEDLGKGGTAAALLDRVVAPVRAPLLTLLGAVGFVLLIACANVANLNLAHTGARRREIAVRFALGASRIRVVRQLFTESLAVALAGGAGGVFLAVGGVDLLLRIAPGEIPRAAEIHVDPGVLAFTLVLACGAGIGFGLVPALASSDVQNGLNQAGRASSGGPAARRARNCLAISEIALSLVLVVGAGLLIESFRRVSAVDPGFDPRGLVTMRIPLGETKYAGIATQAAFYDALLERVRAIPGIGPVSAIDGLPFAPGGFDNSFSIDGRPEPLPGQYLKAEIRRIDESFFGVMRIPLIAGRAFSDADRTGTPDVAIVSQSLARRYWPGENPVGKRLSVHFGNPPLHPEIVGVVADVRSALDRSPQEFIYVPYRQGRHVTDIYLVIRDSAPMVTAVRAAAASMDRDQPVHRVRTMEELLAASLATRRFEMLLLGAFAAVSAALLAIGLYGVLAFTVQARTREIGVRTALGASAAQVFGLVLRDAMKLATIGLCMGLVGALALTRVLEKLLFEVRPTNPAAFAAALGGLLVVALAASVIPARRAARVDPMAALKHE